MALLTVRPNRGTVGFFLLLAAALFARSYFAKQHAQSFRQDAPQTHSTRRLLRCVLGGDVERYLHPRPPTTEPARWERLISSRLRRMVTEYEPAPWLGRCIPIAERLTARLEQTRNAGRATSLARATTVTLRDAQSSPLRALELVESGTLGSQLALLALEAGSLSNGADEAWSSPLSAQSSDLEGDRRETRGPAAYAFAANAEYVTLALPEMALYQRTGDRRLHRVLLDPRGTSASDTDLGRGAPVRGSAREGATLVSDDAGDSVFLPGAEPAALVPLPEPLRRGEHALGEWHVTLAGGALWLATESSGRLSLWHTPSVGAVSWSELLPAPASRFRELYAYGALLSPHVASRDPASTPGAADVGARAAQRGRTRGRNEPPPAGGSLAPARDAAPPASATVRAAVLHAGTTDLRVERWGAGENADSLRLVGRAGFGFSFNAFAPQVRSCTSGDAQYFLVVTADRIVSIALRASDNEDADAPVTSLSYNSETWGAPSGGSFSLSCNARGLLLATEFAPDGRTVLAWFERGASVARPVQPPMYGPHAAIVAATLTERGPLALVQNDNSLRAFLSDGASWSGGALLSELAPFGRAPTAAAPQGASAAPSAAPESEEAASAQPTAIDGVPVAAPPPPSTVSVGALVSDGARVGLLLETHTGSARAVAWVGSREAGLRWGAAP